MVRGQGVSKEKNGATGPVISGQKCGHGTRTRTKQAVNRNVLNKNVAMNEANSGTARYVTGNSGNTNTKQSNAKQKNVDDIVKYIEGSSSETNKKKLKKERQKQERLNNINRQKAEERRLQDAVSREQERINEEEKSRPQEHTDSTNMSKKQLKKANQRAKKLAEEQASPVEPSYNGSQVNYGMGYSSSNQSSTQSNLNLQQLRAKHQRELEMMELKHRHAMEEEQMMASMYGQKAPQSYSQPKYQPPSYQVPSYQAYNNAPSGRSSMNSPLSSFSNDLRSQLPNNGINASNNMSYSPRNESNNQTRSQPTITRKESNISGRNESKGAGSRSNLPPAAREALAKAEKNSGNMIKISRNAQGGVDFTPIPASEVNSK